MLASPRVSTGRSHRVAGQPVRCVRHRGGVGVVEQLVRRRGRGCRRRSRPPRATSRSTSSSICVGRVVVEHAGRRSAGAPKAAAGPGRAARSISSRGAVAGRVDHRVAAQAEADRLQQRGCRSVRARSHGVAGRVAHGQHVVAVDPLAGHAGRRTPLLYSSGSAEACSTGGAHAEPVVDDHVDDRQLPQRGQVERLVEGADVGGARRPSGTSRIASGPARRGRSIASAAPVAERQLAADDAVAAHAAAASTSNRCIEPPRPLRDAVVLAEQLGHHPAGLDAARERVAVLAVVGEQVVARLAARPSAPTTVASSPRFRWQ